MKNILVPVDFSERSENAVVYAMELARHSRAVVTLFHAYHVVEVPAVVLTNEEMEQVNVDRLKKIVEKRYSPNFNEVQVEYVSRIGLLIDGIQHIIEERKVDLVVLSSKGAGNPGDVTMGKNTIKVIEHVKTPVISVPENARFRAPENIVFASDFISVTDGSIPTVVKAFAELFNAHLALVHVIPVNEKVTEEIVRSSENVKNFLKETRHTIHFPVNDDVVEGIHEFARQVKADLIVMMPRKHNFLERIFLESHTEMVAFETSVPLLAVHETED